ncbi:Ig-like domain-containing protein [Calditrichota bacterium GD2]
MRDKLILVFILFSLTLQQAFADQGGIDNFGHMWTDSRGTVTIDYNWIDIKSSANQIFAAGFNDEAPVGVALPFKVSFYGKQHDSLFISPNGWVSFKNPGTNSYPINDSLPGLSAPDSIIAVYWDDLLSDSRYDGGVYYAVTGSAPNRKIVVQWDAIDNYLSQTKTLICELVIFERSNLIKMQYNTIDAEYNGGGTATIGIAADATDGLTYYYGTGLGLGPLTSNMAILFHNKKLISGVTAAISPTSGPAGSYTTFYYRFYNIDLSGAQGIGKLDRFAIKNPFLAVPAVHAIYINGSSAYIQNSQNQPADPGFATWYYDTVTDSLFIRTSSFDVIDSLRVVFGLSLPTSLSQNNAFPSTYDAVLDSSLRASSTDGGYSVNVTSGPVSYYAFNPSTDQSITAGGSVNFTITARDQYGNGVINSETVNISTPGSSTATVSPSASLTFSNDSTLSFSVSDNTVGSFTVRAVNSVNSEVNGESGLISVTASTADHFVRLTAEDPIVVGNDRLLQFRLEDVYGNVVSSASVTFTRVRGNGTFSNGLNNITVTTDANGIAEALYTASTSTAYGSDSIDVVSGAVTSTYVMPLQAGGISYYTFNPSTDQSITAGGSVNFTITARDQYGNGVINSGTVNISTPGSGTATVSPSASLTFSNDSTLSFSVADTVVGSFTVRATKSDNSNIKGESGLITVNAAPLAYVIIRSEANNGGQEVGALNLTTDDAYTFYAAGYDQYGNFISDTDVTWSSTGTLESVNATGTKYTFNPSVAGGSGQIVATPTGGATADQTGTITVSAGALAELRLQTADVDGGQTMGDTSLTADQTLTLYAIGYDADGNYLGQTSANWTLNSLTGTLSPANPSASVTFTPDQTGSGSISAQASANAQISDQTGSITVNAGAISYVLIRDEANGGGQEVGAVSLSAGQTLTLYAAGYDANNNFAGNANVDWSTTGTLTGLSANNTNTYVVSLSPTEPGSGTVVTSNANGWADDATGTITVSEASLASIKIRTAANNGGVELGDSTANAGDSWTLYAAGYDLYGNYLGDVAVKWSASGDSIGYYSLVDSSVSNTFNFTTVNSGKLIVNKKYGTSTLSDASGIIKVNPGAPVSMSYVSSNNFSGSAGSELNDSLAVKVLDAFNNPVPGVTVDWKTQDPTSTLNPPTDLTNTLGISRSKWKLRNTIGKDSAYAVVSVIPDSLKFTANVLESQANALNRWVDASNDSARSGVVKTQLTQAMVVEVTDSLGNPVENVPLTFAVLNYPQGGGDFVFSPGASATTDQTGRASVYFTPGSKSGLYQVTAYNDNLLNSGTVFFSVTADPAAADHIVLLTQNNQQDTVATSYGDSVRVKVVDAYDNPISGVTINWQPTSTGQVNPASSVTNSGGKAATQWILRQTVDRDTLIISSSGLANVEVYANLIPAQPFAVVADSGNYRTAVAGNNQLLRARVEDQYGNVISGQKVSFETLNSNGYLSSYAVVTNENGQAQTTYTSPENVDSSQVRAFITGVDTALFTLYAIRYQSASLQPKVVNLNEPISFYVTVTNSGKDVVALDTANTTFSFANGQFVTSIDSPLVLSPGANRLKYRAKSILSSVGSGNYTPELKFTGSGVYAGMVGTTRTDDGELSVEPVRLLSVTVPAPKTVARGAQKDQIKIKVRNSGNYDVKVDSIHLTFTPDYNFQQVRTSGVDTILAGTDAFYEFSVTVPAAAPEDSITVDAEIFVTAISSGNRVTDSSADQTDYFLITPQADLQYVAFSPMTVSENQQVQFTFQVQNNGQYDIILDKNQTRLEFGGQAFFLTNNQTAVANGVSDLIFAASTVNLAAANSPYAGVLYVVGDENTQTIYDTLYTASKNDSLAVQTIAQLTINNVSLSDTLVSQGEQGDTLRITLQNIGQATARITTGDSVLIQYQSDYVLTPLQSFPFDVPGNSSSALNYLIKVAADAPLGLDTFRVEIGYQDVNSETAYHATDAQKFDSWEVLGKGTLSILSVLTNYDSVSTGQDSILVTMRFKNIGQNAVQLDSAALTFSYGSYVASTVKRYLTRTLAVNQSDTIQFKVQVEATSATGTASINGWLYGHDGNTGIQISDTGADTTDSWLIVSAANLVALNYEPERISSGQMVAPWVTVQNEGQAIVRFDPTKTYLYLVDDPTFRRLLVRPLSIDGLTTDTLFFESDVASGTSGQYALKLNLTGDENGSFYNQDIDVPDLLTIEQGAVLTIDSVIAAAENISQGADTSVVVTVLNEGEATLIVDSLYLSAYPQIDQVTPALPATIAGGGKMRFTLNFQVPPDDPEGLKILDGVARGRDQNLVNSNIDSTLADNSANVPDSWTVFSPASVSVTAITSPDSAVAQGDTGKQIFVTLTNSGNATARINDVQILKKIGLYDFTYPTFGFNLGGNSDTTLTILTDVKMNSATGNDTLSASVNYTDLFSGLTSSQTGAPQLFWQITSGGAAISVISVKATPEEVSRGQQGVNVLVHLKNVGDVDAQIQNLTLNFSNGAANYTQGAVSPAPGTLQPGVEVTYTVPIDVNSTATAGPDTFWAVVDVNEPATGRNYTIEDPNVNDNWVVQLRPDVVIRKVIVSPDTASTGQQNLIASVWVSNEQAAYRADARINSVNLTFRKDGEPSNDQFTITRSNEPSLPIVLQNGKVLKFEFDVDVKTNATFGNYDVYARVNGEDVNDGLAFQVSAVDTPDVLTVQTRGQLNISQTWVAPDTLSEFQDHGKLYIEFSNDGQAKVEVRSVNLQFDQPFDFNPNLISHSTPFTQPGLSRDTLIYALEMPDISADSVTVHVNSEIKGIDLNSNESTSAQSASPASFLLETRASVQWVETDPTSWAVDTAAVQFTTKLTNSGLATVQLDTSATRLQIRNVNSTTVVHQIPLDVQSVKTIAGKPDSTLLTFRKEVLPIAADEYELFLHLSGATNDSVYTSEIYAGQFAFGDSIISIKSVQLQTDDQVVQGADSIIVYMKVSNTQEAKPIEADLTKLIFKGPNDEDREAFILNMTRLDTLTVLKREENNLFKFRFDLAENFPANDATRIYGQIGLDGGALVKVSNTYDELFVQTIGNALYVDRSFSPDTVVAQQKVRFSVSLTDTGSAQITLKKNDNYLQILNTAIAPIYFSTNYSLLGKDTITVLFDEVELPADLAPGSYDVKLHTMGETIGGNIFSRDTVLSGILKVVNPGYLYFSQIDFEPTVVRQGEENVPVTFRLKNSGQSAAYLYDLTYHFKKAGDQQDVSDGWVQVQGSVEDTTISAGDSLEFTVYFNVRTSADTGLVYSTPNVRFNDVKRPHVIEQSDSVLVNDLVRVIRPARLRIDSLLVRKDSNVPNAPYLNFDQNAPLIVKVSNLGQDTVKTATVKIYQNNSVLLGSVAIENIPPGPDSVRSGSLIWRADQLGSNQFKAEVASALDLIGQYVDIAQPLDNSEELIVHQPSQLLVNAQITAPDGALDSVVSVNQQFMVTASVQNLGNSPYGTGQLAITLPNNYQLVDNAQDSVKTFSADNPGVEWTIRPVDISVNDRFDSIRVRLKSAPLDSNTTLPVLVAKAADYVPVKVENKGVMQVLWNIASPPGAADSVLSAGQEFEVQAQFQFFGPISPQNKQARIILPQGFSVKDSSLQNLPDGLNTPPVSWKLVAPGTASTEAFHIYVDALVQDANSGQTLILRSQSLPVRVITPPQIFLSARVKEPAGAKDFVVSTGQKVVLQSLIGNAGMADFDTSGTLRLAAGGGIVFTKNRKTGQTNTTENIIEGFRSGAYEDTLVMPDIAGQGMVYVKILENERPADVNSGLPAVVKRDSVGIAFQIVKRADLVVRFNKSETVDDTLFRSTNQQFNLEATVTNNGQAGLSSGVWLRLDTLGSHLTLAAGDSLSHKVDVGQKTVWRVIAPSGSFRGMIRVTADSARPALDENSGTLAFTSLQSSADTMHISVKKIDNIEITTNFVNNNNDSLIVSTDQAPINIASRLVFYYLLDGAKKVVLGLPEGFTSLDTSLTRTVTQQIADVAWTVRAPAKAMDWQPMVITAMAKSVSIPGLNEVVQTDTIYVKVVEKARLSLTASIVEPAGAIDDSVSIGQLFKLQALVKNQPDVAGVQGQGKVVLRLGRAFAIVDEQGAPTPADSVKIFTEGQPVFWWIKVLETTTRVSSQVAVASATPERVNALEGGNVTPQILSALALQDNQLEIETTELPRDENTGEPAFIQNEKILKTIFISQKANIALVELPADTVSTGQNFAFNVLIQKTDNVINPYLIIQVPSNKLPAPQEPIPVGANNKAVWSLSIPEDYSGSGQETVSVQVVGIDENSGLQVTDQKQTTLTIQLKAKLALSDPVITPITVANTGLLSQGQEITITLKPVYAPTERTLKYAALEGEGSVRIDTSIFKQGFKLTNGSTIVQTFSDTGKTLNWTIKAPYEILTTSFNFNFDALPLDANLNQPAELDKELGKVSVPIRVRQKTIVIKTEPLDVADTSLTRGQKNVPLMSIIVSNKEFDDPLHVNGIKLAFYGTNDAPDPTNLLSTRALFQMLKSLKVIDYDDYQGLAKPTITYAEYFFTDSTPNPLSITFAQTADLEPKTEKKLMVVAEFQNNVVNRMFRAQLQEVNAYDFDADKPLSTSDEEGNKLSESDALISKPFTLVSTNPEEAFGNFPNPFGRQHPYTNIAFLLEEASNVEIRIFTLTGELVWSKKLDGLQRGFYDRLVRWDGRNDRGQRVLNGVYLCAIDIKPLSGGNVKRYITKIAYIK